jgi:hypothetical protein
MLWTPFPGVDSNITENRSSIPTFTIDFTPNRSNKGSLLRYIQERNGIRDNNGSQFLYTRQRVAHAPSESFQVV